MQRPDLIVCVIGASGAGKSTLARHLYDGSPDHYYLPVSTTTRVKRDGEVDGHDYYFVTKEVFEDGIANNSFVEWAEYNNNYYGPTWSEFSHPGIILHVVEDEGARELKRTMGAHILAVLPPDADTLSARLRARGDSEESIQARLNLDVHRTEQIQALADHCVVNNNLEDAAKEVRQWLRTLLRSQANV